MTPTQQTILQNDINHIEIEVKGQEPQPESKTTEPLP
jgi:hypothetical protein